MIALVSLRAEAAGRDPLEVRERDHAFEVHPDGAFRAERDEAAVGARGPAEVERRRRGPPARAGLPSASRVNRSEPGSRPRRRARTIREASAATRRRLRTSGVPRAARSRSSAPSHRRAASSTHSGGLVETYLPDLEVRRSHGDRIRNMLRIFPVLAARDSPMDDDSLHGPRPPHHRHPARLLPRGALPARGAGRRPRRWRSGVLAAFRAAGEPVVHLRHVWDAPDATFMRPGHRRRRDPSAGRACGR